MAEYQEPGGEPYRVFLNEDTIRAMDASFSGRPVFVQHVDGVSDSVDDLRKEADGWVIESFYNAADGKHWVKFIAVTEKAERAIRNGMRLSNCYVPKGPFGSGGLWNGVTYDKEIKGGEYEHLAIVPNPRYEESIILSPEQFKRYNEDKILEVKRLANQKEPKKMKFKLFERKKVENAIDLDAVSVMLEKSGREMTLAEAVTAADASEVAKKSPRVINSKDTIEVDGETVTVAELVEAFQNAKKCNKEEEDYDKKENEDEDDSMENEEDEDEKKKENEDEDMDEKKEKKNKKKANDEDEDKDAVDAAKKKKDKKSNADDLAKRRAAAERLKNAPDRAHEEPARVDLPADQVARGKARYGS